MTIRITRDALRNIGYDDIDEANGGNTALEKMGTKRYGLVISDWNMEPMTGLDLLRHIRTGLGEIPFIIMAAAAHIEDVMAAKKAGANGFIVNPFSESTMKAKIDAVFAPAAC
jgi:two-component system chemotaxis response regulator CheY